MQSLKGVNMSDGRSVEDYTLYVYNSFGFMGVFTGKSKCKFDDLKNFLILENDRMIESTLLYVKKSMIPCFYSSIDSDIIESGVFKGLAFNVMKAAATYNYDDIADSEKN